MTSTQKSLQQQGEELSVKTNFQCHSVCHLPLSENRGKQIREDEWAGVDKQNSALNKVACY